MLTIITYGPRRFVYKSNANQNIYIYTHTLDAVLYFKQSYSLKLKFKILLLNAISWDVELSETVHQYCDSLISSVK